MTNEKRRGCFNVLLANEQPAHAVNEEQLIEAVTAVLRDSQFASASISIAVVDDDTIQRLNRQYLNHDWPTDVLSFVLEQRDQHLEGEVIISADTAAAAALEFGWPAAAEQMLYVVHGMLHLVGHRDDTPINSQAMRAAEAAYLRRFGYEAVRSALPGATAP
jgi:probable rRNA maturation factor